MTPTQKSAIEPLRFDNGSSKLITGLSGQFSPASMQGISALWQRFVPHLGKIPGQVGNVAYGVVVDPTMGQGEFSVLCGVEVPEASAVPGEFTSMAIPALRYAVFTHPGDVTTISQTVSNIFRQWLPQSGQQLAQAGPGTPTFIERYGERFNSQTLSGDIEVWVPVKK